MKMLKRILSIVLSVCVLSAIPLRIIASREQETVTFYYRHGLEVTVELNESLTFEQIKRIADQIAGEQVEEETDHIMLNPQCAAGNHDITTVNSSSIKHNVYTSSPKCLYQEYTTSTCTRIGCFYSVVDVTFSRRISDCHG